MAAQIELADRSSGRIPAWLRGPGDATAARVEYAEVAGIEPIGTLDAEDAHLAAMIELHGRHGDRREKGMRMLWAAASLGSTDARHTLLEEVRHIAGEATLDRRTRAAAKRALDAWNATARPLNLRALVATSEPGLFVDEHGTQMWHEDFVAPKPRDVAGDVPREQKAQRVEAVVPIAVPTAHVVVRMIGDAQSRDGQEMSARYASIVGKALSAKGAIPARGEAAAAILARWPWATRVAAHVEGELAILRSAGSRVARLSPLLLVGPPGGGKTALARAIAALLGVPSVIVPSAGAGDSGGLAAMARGWGTAKPCAPVVAALENGCCNPAIVVDELDKSVSMDARNGSVSGTVLGMLGEPTRYTDSCLMSEVDLSRMSFMATANALGDIPEAVLDRFEAVPVGRPGAEHLDVVLENLRADLAEQLGVDERLLPWLDADERAALARRLAESGGSLRALARAHRSVLSAAALREADAATVPN